MDILSTKQFLADEIMALNNHLVPTPEEFVDIMRKYTAMVLEQHIEHPTKPGYKRSDIVKRIKELKS